MWHCGMVNISQPQQTLQYGEWTKQNSEVNAKHYSGLLVTYLVPDMCPSHKHNRWFQAIAPHPTQLGIHRYALFRIIHLLTYILSASIISGPNFFLWSAQNVWCVILSKTNQGWHKLKETATLSQDMLQYTMSSIPFLLNKRIVGAAKHLILLSRNRAFVYLYFDIIVSSPE
jgi:hypothetical protein